MWRVAEGVLGWAESTAPPMCMLWMFHVLREVAWSVSLVSESENFHSNVLTDGCEDGFAVAAENNTCVAV